MSNIKPIPTAYKGYKFRSRLEARWAVFFDACGVEWEYEPLPNGLYYLPDFLLHGCAGRCPTDLYVEVKGKMTAEDAEKIMAFSGVGRDSERGISAVENPILIVAGIPDGDSISDIERFCENMGYSGFPGMGHEPYPFNFETIDGDYFVAHPGVNKEGRFELFGDDSSYTCERDDETTLRAFKLARQVRFEHGEAPRIWRCR